MANAIQVQFIQQQNGYSENIDPYTCSIII